MKYKLTFHAEQIYIDRLKAKGRYPFPYGGIEWEEGKSVEVTDLSPFYEGERAKKHVHDFLIVEEIHETPEATNGTDSIPTKRARGERE